MSDETRDALYNLKNNDVAKLVLKDIKILCLNKPSTPDNVSEIKRECKNLKNLICRPNQ